MAGAGGSEEKKVTAPAPTESSGGGGKIAAILSIVNLVATLGILGVLFLSFQKEKKGANVEDISLHPPEAEGEKGKEGKEGHGGEGKEGKEGVKKKVGEEVKMINLDQFTVNLSTPGSANPKFVRVSISVEVPNEDVEKEVTLKNPQVRNTIIDLFNSKRPSDLATVDGRDYLKDEIKNALNSFIISGKIKGVYFTSFALAG